MSYIQVSTLLPWPREKVFAALSLPGNLQKTWEGDVDVEVLGKEEAYKKGSEVLFRMTRFGISQPLSLQLTDWQPPSIMSFKQTEGPFKHWVQTIKLEAHSESTTLVSESVDYSLPFGLIGYLADDLIVRSELKRLLQRHLQDLPVES